MSLKARQRQFAPVAFNLSLLLQHVYAEVLRLCFLGYQVGTRNIFIRFV